MNKVCSNCNYWEPKAAVVAKKENYGECNKLSHLESKMDPDYIINGEFPFQETSLMS